MSYNQEYYTRSGIGPTLYVVMESDLRPKSSNNILFKLTDDTNLLS